MRLFTKVIHITFDASNRVYGRIIKRQAHHLQA